MPKCKDLSGKKINYLSVLYFGEKIGNKNYWVCQCVCGTIKSISADKLNANRAKSCGCLKNQLSAKARIKHGFSNTRLSRILNGIIQRCNNPNLKNYNNYGGRGISICNEWVNNKSSFYKWAIDNGYNDNLEIDRINVNGNYEPNNCRWVDLKTQARNKRTSKVISYGSDKLTVAEWCEKINISQKCFFQRSKLGWDIKKIIETPVLKTWSRKKK